MYVSSLLLGCLRSLIDKQIVLLTDAPISGRTCVGSVSMMYVLTLFYTLVTTLLRFFYRSFVISSTRMHRGTVHVIAVVMLHVLLVSAASGSEGLAPSLAC